MLKNLKIIINENGGNEEYEYDFFQEGFEEWAESLDADKTEENLKRYLTECGYNIVKII
jgi:hypothetical protein